jgi:FMN phosphatase YigB (HAD superfamily)
MINRNPRIWTFDVDDSLVMWNLSEFPQEDRILVSHVRGPVELVPNLKNINLLVKLAKIGWYIRVHSGSGVEWAERVITTLGLLDYVDAVEAKPLGNTDDQAPGDGLAYSVYRKI